MASPFTASSPAGASSACALLLLAASCAPDAGPPELAMRVRWSLTDPAAMVPDGVDFIDLTIVEEDGSDETFTCTEGGLAEGGREGRRACVFEGLPTLVPLRLEIHARSGAAVTHVAYAGPFVLSPGQRLFIEPTMFPVAAPQPIGGLGASGRFLHTATALPDGRVLIAGGFEAAAVTTCPDGLPADTRCFSVRAAQTALLYDHANARFLRVQGGMLEPRGGHTATALPDGRVLLAGGSSSALLTMTPQGAGTTGFQIGMMPGGAELASFEIFDPEANPELDDVDGDGDAGRGGFVGAADAPSEAGRLDAARFLATASLVPGTTQVLIAGGIGAESTYTIFDLQRAGGYGVIATDDGALARSRVAAGSVGLGTGSSRSVWVFGGTSPASDADLAEVWTPGMAMDPDGAFESAMEAGFPGGADTHPHWSLFRPLVASLEGGTHAVVVGWYGPLCEAGTTAPVFSPAAPEVCPFVRPGGAMMIPHRSFTVSAATGEAVETPVANPHAFGAIAELEDGRVVVTGGITSLSFDANNTTDVLAAEVGSAGAASSSVGPPMAMPRAFHTSTALPGGGVLSVGGLRFTSDARMPTVIATAEAFYFAPTPR